MLPVISKLSCLELSFPVTTHSSLNLFSILFSGMDFRKAIPRSFLHLVNAAQTWKGGSGQSQEAEELEVSRRMEDVESGKGVSLALIGIQEVNDTILRVFTGMPVFRQKPEFRP